MATAAERIAALEKLVEELAGRVAALENDLAVVGDVTIPAVDTIQDDVRKVAVAARDRQENDPEARGSVQRTLRPSVERVRRPDGRVVQRIVKPR